MGDYLRAAGWYLGTVLFLKDRFPERSDLLSRNYASVLHRAFHSGRRSYPEDVVESLPSMVQSLDLEIARLEVADAEVAEALRSNRDTILNRALHSGNLEYPGEAVEAIPGMLKALEGDAALRSNRATIISRALNRGNFDYPAEAAKRLPGLFAVLDREIARLNPDVSRTARVLEANRATIVMRALADADFDYPEEVVKKLPKLRRTLADEIRRLAGGEPGAAEVLRAHGLTVIGRAINRADWDYPKKVAKALPALIKDLDPAKRAAVVQAALLNGTI
ncbi:MAG TPA: hypothetical protein VFX30_05425 [bacterium]|nr:hypothetical protein [bacterium]